MHDVCALQKLADNNVINLHTQRRQMMTITRFARVFFIFVLVTAVSRPFDDAKRPNSPLCGHWSTSRQFLNFVLSDLTEDFEHILQA